MCSQTQPPRRCASSILASFLSPPLLSLSLTSLAVWRALIPATRKEAEGSSHAPASASEPLPLPRLPLHLPLPFTMSLPLPLTIPLPILPLSLPAPTPVRLRTDLGRIPRGRGGHSSGQRRRRRTGLDASPLPRHRSISSAAPHDHQQLLQNPCSHVTLETVMGFFPFILCVNCTKGCSDDAASTSTCSYCKITSTCCSAPRLRWQRKGWVRPLVASQRAECAPLC
jgi:hypothetical protein